jgi:hypothetical protein
MAVVSSVSPTSSVVRQISIYAASSSDDVYAQKINDTFTDMIDNVPNNGTNIDLYFDRYEYVR